MKKFIAAMLLSIVMLIPANAFAASLEKGAPIGNVLSTDIKAYINGALIPSYNIGGTTVVMASDLKSYGFDVNWNKETREVLIQRNPAKKIEAVSSSNDASRKAVGTVLSRVLYTDIAVFLDGRKVVSYSVNGSTALYLADLSLYGNVVWNGEKKQIDVTLSSDVSKEPLTLTRSADGNFILTNNTDNEIYDTRLYHYELNDYYRASVEGRAYQYPGLAGSLDAKVEINSMKEYPFEANRISYGIIKANESVTIDEKIDPLDGGLALDSYIYYKGDTLTEASSPSNAYKEILQSDRVASYYKKLDSVIKAKATAAKAEEQKGKKVDFKTQALNGPSYNELLKNSSKFVGTPAYFSGRVVYANEDSSGKTVLLVDISADANDFIDMYNQNSDDPNYLSNVESQILAVYSDSSVDILKGDTVDIYGTVQKLTSYTDGYGNSRPAPTVKLVEFKRTSLRSDELLDLMQ